MRTNFFIAAFLMLTALSACFSRKAADSGELQNTADDDIIQDTQMHTDGSEDNTDGDGMVGITLNYTGIVRDMRKKEGCDFMIELDAGNGEKQYLEPLTLDEKYKVDGQIITFNYTDSRRPSNCTLPSKPIVIDKIIE